MSNFRKKKYWVLTIINIDIGIDIEFQPNLIMILILKGKVLILINIIDIVLRTLQQVSQKEQFSSLSGRYLSSLLFIFDPNCFVGCRSAGQLVVFQPSNPETPAWLKALLYAVSS